MRKLVAVTLLVSAAIVVACIDEPTSPQESRSVGLHAHQFEGQRGQPQSIDDEFAAIASAESTFGGAILDSMQVPIVFLTNASRLASARAAGLDALLGTRRIATGNIRVMPAAYGFGALKRWHDCAARLVLGLPDAVFTDIDEAHNRLHFGVATPGAQGEARSVVARCQIPSEAMAIDVVRRIVQKNGGLNETVADSVRPLRGGIKIRYSGDNNYPCTLGIVGRYNDDSLAFLTAGHCSNTGTANQDNTLYWQYTIGNAPDSIGRETVDPTYVSGGPCTGGYSCRFSDVNLSFLRSTATATPGFIALNTTTSYNPSTPGSLAIDTTQPGRFVTAAAYYEPMLGTELCKTGRTTGTTCGAVTAVGLDYNLGGAEPVNKNETLSGLSLL